jgi:hypothetical protein
MTWSLNELESETKKAIRGAGLSWGLAEEGGKAVRWLAVHGADPIPALNDILDRHDRRANIAAMPTLTDSGWHAAVPMCPIALGVTLCDHADWLAKEDFVGGPVARPLLLVPFVAAAAHILKRPLQVRVNGVSVVLDECGNPSCELAALDFLQADEIRCSAAVRQPSPTRIGGAATHGIAIDSSSWQHISAYGHRTYVPASERSRREGAGAGMIDND